MKFDTGAYGKEGSEQGRSTVIFYIAYGWRPAYTKNMFVTNTPLPFSGFVTLFRSCNLRFKIVEARFVNAENLLMLLLMLLLMMFVVYIGL